MNNKFLYVGWLRDSFFDKYDEDYEWPARIYIIAENPEKAIE
jgi:hypothetical protein